MGVSAPCVVQQQSVWTLCVVVTAFDSFCCMLGLAGTGSWLACEGDRQAEVCVLSLMGVGCPLLQQLTAAELATDS